jgi:A/G-specific adenine glycosylase
MLQQTGVETVIPFFLSFIKRFPTVKILADSPLEEVMKAWEGLGYYHRAKNLHQAAGVIEERYHGQIPKEYADIIRLPGIGAYTAGAVLSIAYDLPFICLDGNMHRVFSRLYMDDHFKTAGEEEKHTRRIGTEYINQARDHGIPPSVFNQAYMELGATVCIPDNPRCGCCPVQLYCRAYARNAQGSRPLRKIKAPPVKKEMEVAIIWLNRRIVFERRDRVTVLKNLWGLPMVEKQSDKEPGVTLSESINVRYGITVGVPKYLFTIRHVLTHQVWSMKVYQFFAVNSYVYSGEDLTVTVATEEESHAMPVPKAFRKILEHYVTRKIRVAAGILRNSQGQVFITQRKPGGFFGSLWEFPGGKIEEGETEEAAVIRELEEELGIHVKTGAILNKSTYQYPFGLLEISFIQCDILSGSITLKEHDQGIWIDDERLDSQLFPPADAGFIDALKAKKTDNPS